MKWLSFLLVVLLASAPVVVARTANALALDGFERPPSQGCSRDTGTVTCPKPGFPSEYDVWGYRGRRMSIWNVIGDTEPLSMWVGADLGGQLVFEASVLRDMGILEYSNYVPSDATDGGASDAFLLEVTSVSAPVNVTVYFTEVSPSRQSWLTKRIFAPGVVAFPFDEFGTPPSVPGQRLADPAFMGWLQLRLTALEPVTLAIESFQTGATSARVDVDIKPGSDPNSINPSLEGDLPVAILGSDTFDVAEVDVATLAFGPSGAPFDHSHGPHFEDLNGDGLTDLLAHYRVEEAGIAFGDIEACVTGETTEGTPFEGCDAIRTVPDMDGDELLDVEEAAIGTDALNPDTDGDGFTDGQEVLVMGTDPLNSKDPKPLRGRKRRGTRHR